MAEVTGESHSSNPYSAESPSPKSNYRPEIDGLRALAVVAVIINHFNKDWLPSGYLGVDIFFVISGYVITSSLSGRKSKDLADFILSFYERRIKRLVPALTLFIATSALLICIFNPEPNYHLEVATFALFGLSNISLKNTATDYFAPSTALNPFTHTWSLGVEEQFYLLFPFIIWFSGFGRQKANSARNLFWSIGTLSITSLLAFIFLYQTNQPAAYFLMPPRFWELGLGCLVFLSLQKKTWISDSLRKIPSLFIVILLVALLFLPLSLAVPATISVAMLSGLLICSFKKGSKMFQLFTREKIVYVGLISYSLYLWHWGVLSISRWTIGIHWWSIPFQVALMVLLAMGSYQFVEKPIRQGLYPVRRIYALSAGIGTMATTAAIPFFLSKQASNKLFAGVTANLKQSGVSSLTTPYSIQGMSGKWSGEECVLSDDKEVGAKIELQNCTLGNFSSSKRRVLVIGNSFSAAFVEAFDQLVKDDQYSVTITSSWDATPVKATTTIGHYGKANFYYWHSLLPSLFSKLKEGDIVFAINDLSSFSPPLRSQESDQNLSKLEQGITNLAQDLSKNGVRLIFLHGLPLAREAQCAPNAAIKQWYAPFDKDKCPIPDKDTSMVRREKLNGTLHRLQAKNLLTIIDLFEIFCPLKACQYTEPQGKVLYRDEFSHPSVEAVRLSAPAIRSILTNKEHVKTSNHH